MYANTEAFVRLKKQTQAVLNFTVLISNSVPLLKMTIKNIEKGIESAQLANPDYFKGEQNQDQLKGYAAEYKENLSKYILLSNFSYFEAYVSDAIEEIFNFHGGAQKMMEAERLRCQMHVNPTKESVIENRRKLQDSYKKHKNLKYQKHTNLLKSENFKFPSELLSSYGVLKLADELKSLKSVGIPNILVDGLHFPMPEDDIKEFHRIRDIRNNIAHGQTKSFDMPSAMKYNKFLRELSVKIDSHIVNNYFVIEKFA